MKHFVCAAALLVLLNSCKSTDTPGPSPEQTKLTQPTVAGTYKGTFQRRGTPDGPLANVTLTLAEGKWTGRGEAAKYPGLCEGTYELGTANTISFQNTCVWTAEFDWTLILGGTFEVERVGNELVLTKRFGGSGVMRDEYRLTKQ